MKKIGTGSIILLVIGSLLFIVGLIFHIFHWPDMFKGLYAGPVLILIGIIISLPRLKKK
jgi:predicted membrane channel-forming protein YqfA (hemolysin III family)